MADSGQMYNILNDRYLVLEMFFEIGVLAFFLISEICVHLWLIIN